MRLNSSLRVDKKSVEIGEENGLRHRGSILCQEVKLGRRSGS